MLRGNTQAALQRQPSFQTWPHKGMSSLDKAFSTTLIEEGERYHGSYPVTGLSADGMQLY